MYKLFIKKLAKYVESETFQIKKCNYYIVYIKKHARYNTIYDFELYQFGFTHRVISDKVHRLLVTLSCFRSDRFGQLLSLIPILILLLYLLVSIDPVYTGLRELDPECEQLYSKLNSNCSGLKVQVVSTLTNNLFDVDTYWSSVEHGRNIFAWFKHGRAHFSRGWPRSKYSLLGSSTDQHNRFGQIRSKNTEFWSNTVETNQFLSRRSKHKVSTSTLKYFDRLDRFSKCFYYQTIRNSMLFNNQFAYQTVKVLIRQRFCWIFKKGGFFRFDHFALAKSDWTLCVA